MSSSPPSSDPRLSAAATDPLGAREIEERLDDALDPVLSTRRTAQPLALKLAALLDREQQDFILHWVGVIARTSGEMAYQFAAAAPDALRRLDCEEAEAWIIRAMDAFDREGLHRGSSVLKNIDAFMTATAQADQAIAFEDAHNVLSLFVCGLSGRRLRLEPGGEGYTDTEIIYLPTRISARQSRADNFLIYKAMATHLWAQTRYGTFNADPAQKLALFADPAKAIALYHFLETARIDAILARELPGLARELAGLRGECGLPHACDRLLEPEATAEDSLKLVAKLYASFTPPHLSYMGTLHPERAAATRAARLKREKRRLQNELAKMLGEESAAETRTDSATRFSASAPDAAGKVELRLDGEAMTAPRQVDGLLQSIAQDLGTVPDDYLVPFAAGAEDSRHAFADQSAAEWRGELHEEAAVLYNEWDYRRRHYRKNWCMLREVDVRPGDPDFIGATLTKYRPQVMLLRRTFEMLRSEDKLLKRQKNGDDIDLDAVIAAYADLRTGRELPEQLLVKRHRAERDIAVMFMVDMSGSTKGWVNEAEREALVMLCEALEVLGDRYAIYGFSGMTRKRCEIYRIKRFDEPCDDTMRRRVAGILPQDYTRMGVAIRHLSALLNAVEARTKLLVTLSDGKPDDYSDNYRGEYGIEDTRQALLEAHRAGIHPFCITIDREARGYLPHLYGNVNYTVIDDVLRLPLKVADIYRKLTT